MPMHAVHLLPPVRAAQAAHAAIDPSELMHAFDLIRTELGVPGDFPAEVLAEADAAVSALQPPDRDETSAPFLTIDPPGAKDLDQAMLIERGPSGRGYRVRYAIADVPAFVRPGGAVDQEARRRGQTVYAPDRRTPLHPARLSEDAASLLAGQPRPAFVWDILLDDDGDATSVDLYRAMVRSHDQLDYAEVQRAIDAGTSDERLTLLREVGTRRTALEVARGGASLPMPEQEVTLDDQGRYLLGFRPPVPAEDWNAQISLLTGMEAAEIMLHGEVGILRTMPEPDHNEVNRFRRQARALGVTWPAEVLYGDFLRSLDRSDPRQLALIHEATALFRGAGYTPFDGALPETTIHAAVAAPYAHVTAPLRRLVDRFGLVVCESLCQGDEVPDWVRQALPALPGIMAGSDRMAGAVDRATTDAVEAAALGDRLGQSFDAVVVDLNPKRGALVQVPEPAILAPCSGTLALGAQVRVRLVRADVASRSVRFEPVDGDRVPS